MRGDGEHGGVTLRCVGHGGVSGVGEHGGVRGDGEHGGVTLRCVGHGGVSGVGEHGGVRGDGFSKFDIVQNFQCPPGFIALIVYNARTINNGLRLPVVELSMYVCTLVQVVEQSYSSRPWSNEMRPTRDSGALSNYQVSDPLHT